MERIFPHNTEAEQAVLGSIIIDPDALPLVLDFLLSEHFYHDAHRTIFTAMLHLYHRHEPGDYVTLCEELERDGKLETVGRNNVFGYAYIALLSTGVPTSANIVYYARIVESKAKYRSLIAEGVKMVDDGYNERPEAFEMAEQAVYKLGAGTATNQVVSHVDALNDYMSDLEDALERTRKGVVSGVPTGFRRIDKCLGGLMPSDMIVMAARPGVGKTSSALNFADFAVKQGYQVLFFSLEMSRKQLTQRWLAMNARVDSIKLRDARLTDEEHVQVIDAMTNLQHLDGKLWIEDTAGISATAMRSKARSMHAQHGIDLIIVDYLQLMRPPTEDGRRYENKRVEVGEVSHAIKNLARELDIPVVALAQLSREAEHHSEPMLSHLKDSGDIEQDADVVMFLHRDPEIEDGTPEYRVDFIIAKHRNGPVGRVPLWYIASQTRYENMIEEVKSHVS